MLVIECVFNSVKTQPIAEGITDQDEPGHSVTFISRAFSHYDMPMFYIFTFLDLELRVTCRPTDTVVDRIFYESPFYRIL